MVKDLDLDMEIVEAGVAYTLYTMALVNEAIALNRKLDSTSKREDISKYAKKLKEALLRCNVEKEIPVDLGEADDILRFLQEGELMLEISNNLVRKYSRRQELIFILTCVMGGVISGSTGGVSDATRPARSQSKTIGAHLGFPESVIEQCFDTESLEPFRNYLRETQWSEIIEAKPSMWGFSIDLKKLFGIIRKWFTKKVSR